MTRTEAVVAVTEHRDLVRVLLNQVLRTGHSWRVERDDIEQAGLIGLWRAALNYDPGSEASFLTYASHRVRGAMKDEIRHALGGRFQAATGNVGYRKKGMVATSPVGGCYEFATLFKVAADPLDAVLAHELEDLVDALEKRERTIVLAYDYDGFSLREIGNALGLTESRISQLRSRALKQLAAKVAA